MTDLEPDGASAGHWRRWAVALQASRLTEWSEKWTARGFCTDRADRGAAERAIGMMYGAADLAPPLIVWCGSPLSLALTHAMVVQPRPLEVWDACWGRRTATGRLSPSIRVSVHDSIRMSLARSWKLLDPDLGPIAHDVRNSIGQIMLQGLKSAVEPWVFHAVSGALDMHRPFTSVRRGIGHATADSLDESFRFVAAPGQHASPAIGVARSTHDTRWRARAMRDWQRELVFGQHDVDWLAVLDYFRDHCGWAEKSEALAGLTALAGAAGWALPRKRICWVSERPTLVQRDVAGRLHRPDGPAVVYPDGWELHFWHGVAVRAGWLAQGKLLRPEFVLTWPEAEQRSALAEIAGGWHAVLARLPSRLVHEDVDPSVGALIECTLPHGTARFLRVLCGTGRTFALPVPRECRTARQANAWTYGLSATEYGPEVRT